MNRGDGVNEIMRQVKYFWYVRDPLPPTFTVKMALGEMWPLFQQCLSDLHISVEINIYVNHTHRIPYQMAAEL